MIIHANPCDSSAEKNSSTQDCNSGHFLVSHDGHMRTPLKAWYIEFLFFFCFFFPFFFLWS